MSKRDPALFKEDQSVSSLSKYDLDNTVLYKSVSKISEDLRRDVNIHQAGRGYKKNLLLI